MPRKKKPTIDIAAVEQAIDDIEAIIFAIRELPKKAKRTATEDESLCDLKNTAFILNLTIQDLFDKES